MAGPAPQTPEEGPRGAPSDPLQMSVAEKLACEWEARHDVAARGRSLAPAPIQNYLTHTRCEDSRHPSRAGHRPRTEARNEPGNSVPLGVRDWLRSLTSAEPRDDSGLPPGR